MGEGGYISDAEEGSSSELLPEEEGEVEVSEVVDTPLHLEAFFGSPTLRECHQTGIVDEVVDLWKRYCRSEVLDTTATGKIQWNVF